MTDKELIGFLSFIIVSISTIHYFALTLKGTLKPHVFTWLMWGLVMGISAAARAADQAGPGAWAGWGGAISCASIGFLAIFKGEKHITKGDVAALLGALSAIPVWMMTNNPLFAVLIVTTIDVIAYYPTWRKSYLRPYEEATFPYMVANVMHVISLCANIHYSLTTVLTPAVMIFANAALVSMILLRRKSARAALSPS